VPVPLPERARAAAAATAASQAPSRARAILGLGWDEAQQMGWSGLPDATATGELDGLSFQYDLATDTLALVVDDLGQTRYAPIRELAHLGRVLEAVDAGMAVAVAPDIAGPDHPALTPWRVGQDGLAQAVRELVAGELDARGVA
jgi:hypothetical protein